MEFKLTIERVNNGFSVEHLEEQEDDLSCNCIKNVYQDDSQDEFGELDALREALWQVIDHFGYRGSKHDKRRIKVIIEENGTDN